MSRQGGENKNQNYASDNDQKSKTPSKSARPAAGGTGTYQLPEVETEIQEQLQITLPKYVKNVLIFTGFDSIAAIAEITREDLCYMECFIRNELEDILGGGNTRPSGAKSHIGWEKYFGVYADNRCNFQILPGHKKLLLRVAKFYRSKKDQMEKHAKEEHMEEHEEQPCVKRKRSSCGKRKSGSTSDSCRSCGKGSSYDSDHCGYGLRSKRPNIEPHE